jgi:hypothetical protein
MSGQAVRTGRVWRDVWVVPPGAELQFRRVVCARRWVCAAMRRPTMRRGWVRIRLRDVSGWAELQLHGPMRRGERVHLELHRAGVWWGWLLGVVWVLRAQRELQFRLYVCAHKRLPEAMRRPRVRLGWVLRDVRVLPAGAELHVRGQMCGWDAQLRAELHGQGVRQRRVRWELRFLRGGPRLSQRP